VEIEFGKTFNLGNYETHHIRLSVENVKKENVDAVFVWLTEQVQHLHELKLKLEKDADNTLLQETSDILSTLKCGASSNR
jgi:hypothetical protein